MEQGLFGNIFFCKNCLIARINVIQRSQRYGSYHFLDHLEFDLQRQLQETLRQEEILWHQKSRRKWIMDGDRNTKYYHTKTVIRRRRNRILALCGNNGVWIDDHDALQMLAINFYKDFKEHVQERAFMDCASAYPILDLSLIEGLNA